MTRARVATIATGDNTMSSAIDKNDSTQLATISSDALHGVTGGDGDKPGERYRPMTRLEQLRVHKNLEYLKRRSQERDEEER